MAIRFCFWLTGRFCIALILKLCVGLSSLSSLLFGPDVEVVNVLGCSSNLRRHGFSADGGARTIEARDD